MLFIYYPKCSTCIKAKKWLDEKGVKYTERHIVEENPSFSELKEWWEKSGLPLKKFFNTSGMLYKEMERRGIQRTEDGSSERQFREMIRETEGKDWVVRQVMGEIDNLIASGQKRIVLDGLYSWTEYKELKSKYPGLLTVVAIVVPKALRHFRVGKREERPFTLKEIQERDYTEVENIEKGGPIAMADYYILNDGSVAEMNEKMAEILTRMEF